MFGPGVYWPILISLMPPFLAFLRVKRRAWTHTLLRIGGMYEQANHLVRFSAHMLLALKEYDMAGEESEISEALEQLMQLEEDFSALRAKLEQVYEKTRILNKPEDYILDQDHHHHHHHHHHHSHHHQSHRHHRHHHRDHREHRFDCGVGG